MISMIKPAKQGGLAIYNSNFKQKLQDIVAKIEIASDLTITYEEFEPLKVSSHLQEYLKQLPLTERNQYLAARLQKYLYSIFSNDLKPESDATWSTTNDTESDDESDRQEIANYVKKWSQTKFYQQLKQNNHGRGYNDPNWLVIKQAGDYWHVTKNNLTLHIKPEKHLTQPKEELSPGKLISLKMPPNLVDHGLYIAVGDAGTIKTGDSEQKFTITQLYFNVNSQGALHLLDNLTQKLNAIRIPFNFNLAYDETEFDHLDAAVLEFKSSDFDLIYPIVQTIYQANQTYFQSEIPFFCQLLAPGLGLAEKPRSPNFERENIGQHYCGIIAQALVKIWQQNNLSQSEKLDYVLNYLSEAGIDIERLYLNYHSKRNYSRHWE